jgi:hypothetical protein
MVGCQASPAAPAVIPPEQIELHLQRMHEASRKKNAAQATQHVWECKMRDTTARQVRTAKFKFAIGADYLNPICFSVSHLFAKMLVLNLDRRINLDRWISHG